VALQYCIERKINLDRYPLLVSKKIEHNLNRRIIIPFTWQHDLIGYTARTWDHNIKPKYFSQYEPNYVYNVDRQRTDSKFVIVVEGPFDAMSIDGVAVLSNECSETQADIIDQLDREIILVPDRDRAGDRLITNALEYGWSVSFPVWHETCKDVNEAVVKYGKLFVLKSILSYRETSKLKIELKRKKLYN
jgi:DNA primase